MGAKSRNRLIRRLKKNADYRALVGWCNEQGLDYAVHTPRGVGHPYLTITDGRTTIRKTVTVTPSNCGHVNTALKAVKKKWEGSQ